MTLNEAIVRVAQECIGMGEEGKNNSGFFVNRIRRAWKVYGKGEWCAHFGAFCCEEAHYGLNMKPPRIRARSARKFAKLVQRHGMKVSARNVQPGDFELRNRPGPGMHIGIVEEVSRDGTRVNIEGNVGRFPAKVKRVNRDDPRFDDAHVGFYRLKDKSGRRK